MESSNYPILCPRSLLLSESFIIQQKAGNSQVIHDFSGNIIPNNGVSEMKIDDMKAIDHRNEQFAGTSEEEAQKDLKKKKSSEKQKVRKPRYAFQTRSQVDVLDDGYRWRKYGQKAVKNNKFPRSYYRCTHRGCNVKKQVQRLSKDEGLVVTTYEGIHSHAIEKPTDNFENILSQMHIYTPPFLGSTSH